MLKRCIMPQYLFKKIVMKKDKLKSLINELYENLLSSIDEEGGAADDITKEQVIHYLHDSAKVISDIYDNEASATEYLKSTFTNKYEEIAKNSITSYENTNNKFKELSDMQKDTLNSYNGEQIDLESITTKFTEIQDHMSDEIKKANTIIAQLSDQIKILEETSNLDSLTKVFNRRALTNYLSEVCVRENKTYDVHLLILDIDDFKIINDKHGHVAGDKVLIFISNILKKTLRDGDKIFRYGGEEFVIVLNRIDTAHCSTLVNRLLDLIRRNNLIYKGNSLNVTMSIGLTKLLDSDTPDTLITRADKALYKAKHNGKDQMQSDI